MIHAKRMRPTRKNCPVATSKIARLTHEVEGNARGMEEVEDARRKAVPKVLTDPRGIVGDMVEVENAKNQDAKLVFVPAVDLGVCVGSMGASSSCAVVTKTVKKLLLGKAS